LARHGLLEVILPSRIFLRLHDALAAFAEIRNSKPFRTPTSPSGTDETLS